MTPENRELLVEAVNVLITAPDAAEKFEALTTLGALALRLPVKLSGDAAVLNPLLRLRVSDLDAYNSVLDMIDLKRGELGKPPLRSPSNEGYDKTDYMRQFMDQKREREKLAVEIENLRRPEKDRLIGHARMEFMRLQSVRWKGFRDRALERAKTETGGMNAETRKAVLAAFWNAVDNDLAEKLKAAKRAQLDPSSRTPDDIDIDIEAIIKALNLPPRRKH